MSHVVSMPRIMVFSACLIVSLAAGAGEASPELATGARVAVGAGPADMVFSADGQQLYVTENEDNTVVVVDVARRSVLRRFGDGGWKAPEGDGCSHNFCRGSGAAGIAVDAQRQRAYVSSWNINALTAFDLRSGQALWSTPLQRFPQPLLLTPDGAQAWVFNGVANSLSVVDAATGEVVADALPLDGGDARNLSFGRQLALTMAVDGRHLYVNSIFGDGIEVFDTAKRSRSALIESGASPYDLAVDRNNGNLVALYEDGVVDYAAATLSPLRAYRFCNEVTTWNMALSDDGRLLALTFPKNALAMVVARDSGLLTHVFQTDAWPMKVAFSPDSRLLAVLNAGDTASVSLLDVHAPMDLEPLRSQLSELFCQPNTETMQWMR